MTLSKNPFTPSFGSIPRFMAGRESVLEDMARAFDEGLGNPDLATLLVGPRGTGKTALLSRIAEEALAHGWVAVSTTAIDGMLEDVIQQAGKAAAHLVAPAPSRRLVEVGIGQILNLDWVFEPSGQANWRMRIEALLERLAEQGAGLLITVDEVRADVEEMVQLVATYQLLVREGLSVSLVMAGLPMEVTDLVEDRRVTFLRRARQRYLGLIEEREVRQAFARTVESAGKRIESDALDVAVAATDGFAYMMQLVGYFTWSESGEEEIIRRDHAERGVRLARGDFRRGVLDATYNEMSGQDRAFARAMLADARGSRLVDIAKRMGKSSGYASTYKRRLLKQGVIGERPGGLVDFDLPFMREYLEEAPAE